MEKIDRIRIGKDYVDSCPFNFNNALELNPEKLKVVWKNRYSNSFYIMQLKLFKEEFNSDKFSEQPHLTIDIYNFKNVTKIRINNSLRKWHFGKNSTRDFNQETLTNCLNELASLLLVETEDLLCFKIYEIELGVTFKLPAEYKLLLPSLSEHKDFKLFGQFNNHSSVYFNAKDIGIICYDVLQKQLDKNQISKNAYNKLSNKFFFLRLELKIKKRSAVEFANEKMYLLKDLILNKKEILKYWISKMDNIRIEEKICIEKANLLKDLSPKDYKEYACNKFIEIFTWAKFNTLIDVSIKDNPKKKYAVKKSFRIMQEKCIFAKTTSNAEIFKEIILSVK